jgi:hypothetical protein
MPFRSSALLLLSLPPLLAWRWDAPELTGAPLVTRAGAAATEFLARGATRPKLLACGGADAAGRAAGGCDLVDPFASWRVERVIAPGPASAPARVDGVVAVLGDLLVAWGGRAAEGEQSVDGCEVFSTATWAPVAGAACQILSAGYQDRWGHSGVVFNGSLLVYGGAVLRASGEPDRDVDDSPDEVSLMALARDADSGDVPSFSWTAPAVRATRPLARHWHAAALVPRGTAGAAVSRMIIQ